jgi:hypothetical protein
MLKTHKQVIDALGGTKAVAELTGSTYAAAWNWGKKQYPKFPAAHYLKMKIELDRLGLKASTKLWSFAGGE